MRPPFLSLTVFLLLFSLEASSRVIIENATLIDAAALARENMTVVVQGDEIKYIEKSNSTNIYITNKDSVIDATGKFLIPGLWDAHVHLTFIPELDYETAYKLFLMNGITSIRDTGAVLRKLQPAIDFANENPHTTPRLFFSGPLIDGNPRVYKGGEPGFPELSIEVSENTDLEALVDDLIKEGVSFLKTYEMLSPSTFIRLLKIAKQKNLRVTSHIPLSMDLTNAVDAGLGGMQHIRNLDLACAENAEEILAQRQELLKNLDLLPGSALRSKIHLSQRYAALGNIDDNRCNKIIKYLATNRKRNLFISKLAATLDGNTLILAQYIEKQLVPLCLIIKELCEDRTVHIIYGATPTEERERARELVEREKNAIIVASYGVFSMGINIKRLHNIIFASPYKSQIKVLQSIGRGLRLTEDKTECNLFDIADDMSYNNKRNYTLKHFEERISIYSQQEFSYEILPIKLKSLIVIWKVQLINQDILLRLLK